MIDESAAGEAALEQNHAFIGLRGCQNLAWQEN
jgi:hypothetical protein